ncbi:hypothetical protein [uncultured Tessaracoccus sp.]|uniref:WXG100-like domain-containing protein n=1 Tax=uncultured Tessaracoccus sp. TaxID=905023 RepID=UPI0025D7BA3D|nr:hypothetical protein [uncultured Tessaracoccus sp.]
MAMMLPGWLTEALQYLGYEWPSSNEDILANNADAFRDAGADADSAIRDIQDALKHILSQNESDVTAAFEGYMRGDESNLSSLEDFKDACDIIAGGFDVMSAAVVTLKLAVIAELVVLAVAIAGAVLSGGTASGPALAAREAAKRAVDFAINVAIEEVLG